MSVRTSPLGADLLGVRAWVNGSLVMLHPADCEFVYGPTPEPASADDALVDRIQQTRTDNNVEWMTILRIALEATPERTKAVLRRIEENDRKIHDSLRELANG